MIMNTVDSNHLYFTTVFMNIQNMYKYSLPTKNLISKLNLKNKKGDESKLNMFVIIIDPINTQGAVNQ